MKQSSINGTFGNSKAPGNYLSYPVKVSFTWGRSQLTEGTKILPVCDHLLLCFPVLLINSYFYFCISQFSFLMPCTFSKMESHSAASDHGQNDHGQNLLLNQNSPSIYCYNHPLC